MKPLFIVLLILLCILLIFLIILYIVYRMAYYNDNKQMKKSLIDFNNEQYSPYKNDFKTLKENALKLPFEKISIKSYDNKVLCAKYYHVKDGAPIDILFHGYKGNGINDFAGGIVISRTNNHNVILVDHRGHGESDGHTISFGIKERYDVLSWCNYAVERFGSNIKITLVGISMGAATVLMASNLDLPKNVSCIIADCPYSSPKKIILKVAKDMKVPSLIAYPLVYLSAIIFGHFNINKMDAVTAVKKTKIPILLVHGTSDLFVPYYMSEEIAKSNENITLIPFQNAAHGISYITDPKRYHQIVEEFLRKNL